MSKKFLWPKDFLWGTSTSAHQIEGGNINNWSIWELHTAAEHAKQAPHLLHGLRSWQEIKSQASNPENYVSGRATDHFRRYTEDFDIIEKLGMNAFRFSVEWSRIQPTEDTWNSDVVEHYRNYIRELRSRGIEPIMTLVHLTTPTWFSEKGGFEKRGNIKYFVEFAEHLLRVLSDEITHVVTINEPDTVAVCGYWTTEHPPGKRSIRKLVSVYYHQLVAHKKIYKIAKRLNNKFNVGFVKSYAYVYAADENILSKTMVRLDYLLRDDIQLAYIGNKTDFLGVNFYFTDTYRGTKREAPDTITSDLGWPLLPESLEPVLKRLSKANMPIIITETGLADKHDLYRKLWLDKTILSVRFAIEAGADIRGYLYWSLLDNFEWANGKWPAFGLVDVDYENNFKRTIRRSGVHYATIIKRAKVKRSST